MYDLIGDIHGRADELVRLLDTLGYRRAGGVYRHAARQAIFLGDFVDRGPKILQVLDIVRHMIEGGAALGVMGNHELNALAYHSEDPEVPGQYLRPHSPKNERQHHATVEQLTAGDLASYLAWFRTLPLSLELDGLRVVHACWDDHAVATVTKAMEQQKGMSDALLRSACTKGQPLFGPVDIVLKGKEARLPEGQSFHDSDGAQRTEVRARWYLPPQGHTYRSYALQSGEIACDLPLDAAVIAGAAPYPAAAKPVFVGHYGLSADRPQLLADNVSCLDFSVARGGFLCGYRWQGEQKLTNDNFVWVTAGSGQTGGDGQE